VLQSQGHQLNQQITVLSDGGATGRARQRYLNPPAEPLLDGLHVTLRLTVLQPTAKGVPNQRRDEERDDPLRDPVGRDLDRLNWVLWPGNVDNALQVVQSVEMDLDAAGATRGQGTARKRLKAVEECHPSREDNGGGMPTDGERSRPGERLSTGVVESTVKQVIRTRVCTKPPRAWTPRGAHRRWQVRTRGRNGDGDATVPQW
jgi:hypothetical protein